MTQPATKIGYVKVLSEDPYRLAMREYTGLQLVTLLVPEYDAAIDHYVGALGFELVEDTDRGEGRRWVVVRPAGGGAGLVLARASTPEQVAAIGNQTGGRVGFFWHVDDFAATHARLVSAGVELLEEPRHESYGSVVVFRDGFGNRWDLMAPAAATSSTSK